jgi:hypothetical protein
MDAGRVWKTKYSRVVPLALPRCYIYTDKNAYFLYGSGVINSGSSLTLI